MSIEQQPVETPDPFEVAYRAGQAAFERGRYRQAVEYLEVALAQVDNASSLGGDVQLWLVTSYQALGQQQAAIALCRRLKQHPQIETRKQARRLLEVLEAPVLSNNLDKQIQIPDLSQIEGNPVQGYKVNASTTAQPTSSPLPETFKLSEKTPERQEDNRFLWVALVSLLTLLGSFFLLG
ncbi:MAG: tetratricopeptide repeat protein [Microcoleaceae cyanobacterium]